jgi:hypothetical protein
MRSYHPRQEIRIDRYIITYVQKFNKVILLLSVLFLLSTRDPTKCLFATE